MAKTRSIQTSIDFTSPNGHGKVNEAQARHLALQRARKFAARSKRVAEIKENDGLKRETFRLPRDEAREKAREYLENFPKQAYWTRVESYKVLTGGEIEFTMCRLPTAD